MTIGDFFYYLFLGVVILLIIAIIVGMTWVAIYHSSKTEVETYTVGCEVSQMAYAEEQISRTSSRPVYKMGVRNDDFATTFDITNAQFAKYAIGDVVEVEVTVYEYRDGMHRNQYKLVE